MDWREDFEPKSVWGAVMSGIAVVTVGNSGPFRHGVSGTEVVEGEGRPREGENRMAPGRVTYLAIAAAQCHCTIRRTASLVSLGFQACPRRAEDNVGAAKESRKIEPTIDSILKREEARERGRNVKVNGEREIEGGTRSAGRIRQTKVWERRRDRRVQKRQNRLCADKNKNKKKKKRRESEVCIMPEHSQ